MLIVLRLGHRKGRDKRISTHVGLSARALGASGIIYTGSKDTEMMDNVKQVVSDFGGFFSVKFADGWKDAVNNARDQGFTIVHLTAYGIPVQKRIRQLRRSSGKVMVIVGGEKVPKEVFEKADYNIAIGNQPHSEVSSLAIFLHMYQKGNELRHQFTGGKKNIVPQEKGKQVDETEKRIGSL